MSNRSLLGKLLFLTTVACGPPPDEGENTGPTRVLSPSGFEVVSYSRLPPSSELALPSPIQIGQDGEVFFGSISDIGVRPGGEVVVLDYRVSELRWFDPLGSELPMLAGPGEGPGEIGRAIGMAIQPNGVVWVNDFGNSRYTSYPPDGDPTSTQVQPLRMRGLKEGGVSASGQPWIREDHLVEAQSDPEGGLTEGLLSSYLVPVGFGGVQPADSIFLGQSPFLSADLPQGRGSRRVRFTNRRLVAFDPKGAIWTAESDRYELVRMTSDGDTTLVVNVDLPGTELPEELRRQEMATLTEWYSSVGAPIPDLEAGLPHHFPRIENLAVDEAGSVWVQRHGEQGPVFDRLSASGEYTGRFLIGISPWEWGAPAVGWGRLVVIASDSLDVQSLLVWPIPK